MKGKIEMEEFLEIKKLMETGVKFKSTQIARRFNISDKTAKKYMNMEVHEFKKYKEKNIELKQRSKLDPYKEFIEELFKEFPFFTAAQIFDHLLEKFGETLPVKYGTVKIFVRKYKELNSIGQFPQNYERQYQAVPELPYGLQAQVDLDELHVKTEKGNYIKIYACCMVLSRSRYKFGVWLDRPFRMKDFISFHYKCFAFFQGVPQEIYYDRTKLALIEEVQDEKYKLPEEFLVMSTKYRFNPKYCKGYDPESKGKIEAVVKYSKNNFARGRVFKDLDDWNRRFLSWLDRTGNKKIHEITKKVPAEEFVLEKPTLQPTLLTDISSIPYSLRKDNTVMYRGNRYAVPKGTYSENKKVLVVHKGNHLTVAEITGEFLAEHEVPETKGNLVMGNIEKISRISILDLKSQVLELLENTTEANYWLNSVIELHPKNQRKYFIKILKTFVSLDKNELQKSLKYCVANQKWNPDDVLAITNHFSEENKRSSEQTITPPPMLNNRGFSVPVRDIEEYDQICGGGVKIANKR